jgi:hypothetical protein
MEIIESIAWISVGFIPMFVCLDVTWRKAAAKGSKVDKLKRQEEEMVSVANVL